MYALLFYRVKVKMNKVENKTVSNSVLNENENNTFGGIYVGQDQSEISKAPDIGAEMFSNRCQFHHHFTQIYAQIPKKRK